MLDWCVLLDFPHPSSWTGSKGGGSAAKITAGMKYNYHVPAYTRASQYTPSTYHTPTYYSPTQYTATQYTSAYTLPSKYGAATTHYSPSKFTSTYRATPTYIPSYSKGSRYSSTPHMQTRESPATVIAVAPPKRSVHFPNDIVFQDIVRRGDMEQIGRFMRARKVRIDTLFHSGETALHARAHTTWKT